MNATQFDSSRGA